MSPSAFPQEAFPIGSVRSVSVLIGANVAETVVEQATASVIIT
jgi:hypothetical protein